MTLGLTYWEGVINHSKHVRHYTRSKARPVSRTSLLTLGFCDNKWGGIILHSLLMSPRPLLETWTCPWPWLFPWGHGDPLIVSPVHLDTAWRGWISLNRCGLKLMPEARRTFHFLCERCHFNALETPERYMKMLTFYASCVTLRGCLLFMAC